MYVNCVSISHKPGVSKLCELCQKFRYFFEPMILCMFWQPTPLRFEIMQAFELLRLQRATCVTTKADTLYEYLT